MASLIHELQKEAMDSKTSVSDLLRKALVVASKLDLKELDKWIQKELHGYGDEMPPEYRIVNAELKVFSPYQGYIPVVSSIPSFRDKFSKRPLGLPIGELEDLISDRGDDRGVYFNFTPELNATLMKVLETDFIPSSIIERSAIFGILEKVRNTVLEWSLKLEKEGIRGDNLSFSDEEKHKARNLYLRYPS
jgi:hypothetical protein